MHADTLQSAHGNELHPNYCAAAMEHITKCSLHGKAKQAM